MNENELEVIDSPIDTETTENTEVIEDLEIDLEEPKEDVDFLKKQIETLRAQKEHWKSKAVKPNEVQIQTGDISTTDLYSLVDKKVPQEDVPDIKEYAKMKGMTVTEALNTSFIKLMLRDKEEQRVTARATNVANGRRSMAKLSDDSLMNKARKGELPEDDDDLARLILARRSQLKSTRNN
jgi:hypothetical protein